MNRIPQRPGLSLGNEMNIVVLHRGLSVHLSTCVGRFLTHPGLDASAVVCSHSKASVQAHQERPDGWGYANRILTDYEDLNSVSLP